MSVPLTVTVSPVKLPVNGVPLPLLPAVPMKYSAATMLLLVVPASLMVALMVGGVLVGLGVTVRFDVVGPGSWLVVAWKSKTVPSFATPPVAVVPTTVPLPAEIRPSGSSPSGMRLPFR